MKPQDIVIVLAHVFHGHEQTYAQLSAKLGMSASQLHAGVRRAQSAGLLSDNRHPQKRGLLEFLIHGLKYVFPAQTGVVARGIPTSYSAEPLRHMLQASSELVWASPSGKIRGESIVPLHPSVPKTIEVGSSMHQSLALIDAIRAGRARERRLAEKELKRILT